MSSESAKRNPKNPALGRRQIIDGKVSSSTSSIIYMEDDHVLIQYLNYIQAADYSWISYQDAYNSALKIASAIRTRSLNPVCNLYSIMRYCTFVLV